MKHFLGLEIAGRQTLAIAVFEQLRHFSSGLAKTPDVRVGSRRGLFFFPQGAVPERGLMDALPLKPFIALSLRLDRKSTRLNSSHIQKSRMPSSA